MARRWRWRKKRKEHGNALFKAAKWARAIAKYKSAAEAVGSDVRRSPILQHTLCAIVGMIVLKEMLP